MLFAQNANIKDVSSSSKLNKFINRHIQQNLNILINNPRFMNSSKAEVLDFFATTKTAKFIGRHKKSDY